MSNSTAKTRELDKLKSCQGKQKHSDAASALMNCLEVLQQVGQHVVAYKCRHCDGYHTGRNPPIILRFIEAFTGYEPPRERAPVHLTIPLAEAFERGGVERP